MSLSDRLATARDRAEFESVMDGGPRPTRYEIDDPEPVQLTVTDALAGVIQPTFPATG